MWPNNGFSDAQTSDEFFQSSFLPQFPMFPAQDGYLPQMMTDIPAPEAAQLGFAQNQVHSSFMQNTKNLPTVQFNSSSESLNTPSPVPAETPRPASKVQLTTYAAELKEKLMKRNAQRTRTPTAGKTGGQENPPADNPSSDRMNGTTPQPGQEQDLETMISELANAAPLPNIFTTATSKPAKRSTPQPAGAMSSAQQSPPSSPASVPDASANNLVAGQAKINDAQRRQAREASEMSEGEILDEHMTDRPDTPQTTPKSHPTEVLKTATKDVNADKAPIDGSAKVLEKLPAQKKTLSPKSPSYEKLRRLPLQGNKTNGFNADTRGHQEVSSKTINQPMATSNRTSDTAQCDNWTTPHDQQNNREIPAPPRKASLEHVPAREDQQPVLASTQPQEAISPLFLQVLREDRDLDDWLRITGYYNKEYRTGILADRREFEIIDAHRNKLLEKMAKSERPPPHLGQSPLVSAPVLQTVENALTTARDNTQSNKRPYHEMLDVHRGSFTDNAPRFDDRRDERPRSGHADQSQWRDDRDKRPRRSRSRDRYESPTRYMESRKYSYDESRPNESGQRFERPYQSGRNFSTGNYTRGRGGHGRGGGRGGY